MTFDEVAAFLPGFYDETLQGLMQIPSRRVSVYFPNLRWDTTLTQRMFEAAQAIAGDTQKLELHPLDVTFFTVVDPIRLLTNQTTMNSWFLFKSFGKVLRNADAVLIGEPHTFYAAQVMREASRRSIPVAVYSETSNNVIVSRLIPYGQIARRVVPRANHCVAGTRRASRYLMAKGAKQSNLWIQPLPFVDVARFHPGPEQDYNNARILFVGRLEQFKGFDTLIAALEHLGRTFDLELTVVGKGSLQHLLNGPHSFKIKHFPFLTGASYADVFRSVNVFCAASRDVRMFNQVIWEEVLGMAPLLAMASGLACVFSRCGNLPDLAVEETPLFEPGNIQDLVRAIRELTVDSARMRRGARAGQEMVAHLFEPKKIAAGWRVALS